MNTPPPGWREHLADELMQHAQFYTIVGVAALIVTYAIRTDFGSLGMTAAIGDSAKFLLASFGVLGGVLAVFVMALLPKGDFPKLAQFQFFMILGSAISALTSAIVILNMLGVILFRPGG